MTRSWDYKSKLQSFTKDFRFCFDLDNTYFLFGCVYLIVVLILGISFENFLLNS